MLETRIRRFVTAHALLAATDRVLVAYSGGPDSTALLLLMRNIEPGTAAVYVNHNLRGEESLQEEQFVRRFCEERGIPLFVEQMRWRARPSNLEEAARKRRYRHLARVAMEHGYTKVALAHHRDDVAETLLMRMLRGSGPLGLAGPAPRRGMFIRPFLDSSRNELRLYLKEQQVPYFTDSSNSDAQFTRNRLRIELIPHLAKQYNPRLAEALCRLSRHQREQNELIEELLRPLESRIRQTGRGWAIARQDLTNLGPALQKALLRRAIHRADPSLRPDSRLLERLQRAVAGQQNLELPGFLMVESSREVVLFSPKAGPVGSFEIDVPCAGGYPVPATGAVLLFTIEPSVDFESRPDAAYLDADRASFPLHVRNWKKGDSFRPLGMEGRRKLSDYWIDRKVPRSERTRIPLVFKDDDLVWVSGHRLNHEYRITKDTRRVLKIELKNHV